MATKKIVSTKTLYGISPEILADMSYRQALKMKISALRIKVKDSADAMFEDGGQIPYEKLCQLQSDYKYYKKALKLNEFMLEELS